MCVLIYGCLRVFEIALKPLLVVSLMFVCWFLTHSLARSLLPIPCGNHGNVFFCWMLGEGEGINEKPTKCVVFLVFPTKYTKFCYFKK